MNCHATITPDSEKLKPLRESMKSGNSVPWVRVHDLPDYVYFDHRAHVGQGVSCFNCHGRIDRMEQVHQVETLSMGWCLDCHRNPAPNLRPREYVTDPSWTAGKDQAELGERLMQEYKISPSTDCSACHR
jgi:menaquinone reductase, multiheme cytochrome c subunit